MACSAVSDLTFAERPGRDVVSAEAELGVLLLLLRGCLLFAWTEVCLIPPHAMKNDSEFSGDRDFRLPEPDGLGQAHAPGFQARPGLHSGQQHAGRLEQTGADHAIAEFGDASAAIDFAGLIAPRREAEEGANAARSLEMARIFDGSVEGEWPRLFEAAIARNAAEIATP